jgi:hypothetical protein
MMEPTTSKTELLKTLYDQTVLLVTPYLQAS